MNFIVFAPWEYMPHSGGHIALHTLTKNLCDLGQDVTILEDCGFKCNAKVVKIWKGETLTYDKDNTVVIYPEIMEGNPLEAKHVIRWILYDVKPEVEATWRESDYYFYNLPRFKTIRKETKKILTAFNFDFTPIIKEKTKDACILLRKKAPEHLVFHADILTEPTSIQDFCEQVAPYEIFYTHDDATFYSEIAYLCGCRSIILSNPPRDVTTSFETLIENKARSIEETKELIRVFQRIK